MKNIYLIVKGFFRIRKVYPLLISLAIMLFVTACNPMWNEPRQHTDFSPILMSRQQLETSIAKKPAYEPINPGKIYYKDKHIFINEKYKGVHVINNQNPANPTYIAFVQVPGCMDMAIKNQTLYVDNAIDLVAIDISDINNLKVTGRVTNVFPEVNPPDLNFIPNEYTAAKRPENTIIIGWEKKQ